MIRKKNSPPLIQALTSFNALRYHLLLEQPHDSKNEGKTHYTHNFKGLPCSGKLDFCKNQKGRLG